MKMKSKISEKEKSQAKLNYYLGLLTHNVKASCVPSELLDGGNHV